ncbi:hypothetical protein Cob_v002252 [Colletotrichum orbiculare MAFF 240422]|uniref:Uncharacterized protein n=1 Tax=Colletotrichum orbiculare (strain 104-T / ATCC 96160 / CBS 514.97 / LARS 414 / MAFF 240422) TaxID=1213857 RepID=A0A484G337_COLOR|nr:hypothetical protein Cob_v002252 [Colletotrichum orbiculare MAFF 240422]
MTDTQATKQKRSSPNQLDLQQRKGAKREFPIHDCVSPWTYETPVGGWRRRHTRNIVTVRKEANTEWIGPERPYILNSTAQ